MEFRWNDWNLDHVGDHGVSAEEAEFVVSTARRPFPRRIGDEKWIVWGPGQGGRLVQVIFLLDENQDAYIIHARPLTENEKKRYRKRTN